MSELRIEVDSRRVAEAIRRAPRLLESELHRALGRIGHDIARDAKAFAPKGGTSLLTNAINVRQPDISSVEVFAGVQYSTYVEKGTPPHFPNVQHIQDWVEQAGLSPNTAGEDSRDVAWRIARSIAVAGTPAQPFMEPALEKNRANAGRRVNAAIDRALEAA